MIAAIVPAAGRSERMGRPKLILPIGDTTLISRVIAALRQGGAAPVVVVTPPRDAPGAAVLAGEAEAAGALVVVAAERPADMRASFELGLARLAEGVLPSIVLLVPADCPGITPGLVAQVASRSASDPHSLVVPVFRSQRGHPLALPWELAARVRALPPGAGINALVALHAERVVEIDVDDAGAVDDLDTPGDYERWTRTVEVPPEEHGGAG